MANASLNTIFVASRKCLPARQVEATGAGEVTFQVTEKRALPSKDSYLGDQQELLIIAA